MARYQIASNGRLFVAADRYGITRELCWPEPGAPNHLAGLPIRQGVFSEGRLSWLDSGEWDVSHQSLPSGATLTTYESASLGMTIEKRQWVEADADIWVQEFAFLDHGDRDREVILYQSQRLKVGETDIGDTCFYHEPTESMVHFKSDQVVMFAGRGSGGGIDQIACGIAGVMGLEGTWRDAEDGHLSGKPIEQGSVDSTFGLSIALIRGEANARVITVCGSLLETCCETLAQFENAPLEPVEPSPTAFPDFPKETADWLDRSVEVVFSHIGARGNVFAAVDSDIMQFNRSNYAFVWMRDAALTLSTLHDLNLPVGNILDFLPEYEYDRFLWQKYDWRGHRASTWHPHAGEPELVFPHQEDETALLTWYLSRREAEAPFLTPPQQAALQNWVNLLVGYRHVSGLPGPSWDLWEERFGIHFWTVATVIEALQTASQLPFISNVAEVKQAASEMAEAAITHFRPHNGIIPRRFEVSADQSLIADFTPDSSVLAGAMFSSHLKPAFHADAHRMVGDHLLLSDASSGVARYSGDYYCRVREGYAGNAWIICTMWWAQSLAERGDVSDAQSWLEWARQRSTSTGLLSEQIHPDTNEPLSVMPLTWSHAEVLATALKIRQCR